MSEVVSALRGLPYGERAAKWHAVERVSLPSGDPRPSLTAKSRRRPRCTTRRSSRRMSLTSRCRGAARRELGEGMRVSAGGPGDAGRSCLHRLCARPGKKNPARVRLLGDELRPRLYAGAIHSCTVGKW
jgi:hypothetical protein